MGSSSTHDFSRAVILARLSRAWEKVPKMTLYELFCKGVELLPGYNCVTVEDIRLVEAIERWVLLHAPTEPPKAGE